MAGAERRLTKLRVPDSLKNYQGDLPKSWHLKPQSQALYVKLYGLTKVYRANRFNIKIRKGQIWETLRNVTSPRTRYKKTPAKLSS